MKAILRFQLPATQGSDLAGVVVEVGHRVTRFKAGNAVFASIFGLRTLEAFVLSEERRPCVRYRGLTSTRALIDAICSATS